MPQCLNTVFLLLIRYDLNLPVFNEQSLTVFGVFFVSFFFFKSEYFALSVWAEDSKVYQ